MRRFLALIVCCLLFVTTAFADNGAASVQSGATVASDGSCQVSISMTIRIDQPVSGLSLPLGSDLSSVRLNGAAADLYTTDGITSVRLDKVLGNVIGTIPVHVSFTVNSVVSTDEDGKQLVTVPLLYGFTYPVEAMSFSVAMPGPFDTVPTFLSGYHQQDIESDITYSVSGTTVTGSIDAPLKDHETLVMTLEAPEGMFPQAQAAGGTVFFDTVAMGVCGALALLYWLITMSCMPRMPIRRSTAPDGITAGTMGCYLTRSGADLSMMVVTWAQLGYLIIHVSDHGRVMLHKKMEMGNERSAFESRMFRALFSKGGVIDATSLRYARLCEKAVRMSARHNWGLRKRSGNPMVIRVLGCVMGLFAGLAIGDSMTTVPVWRIILMVLLGVGGLIAAWHIQKSLYHIHLRGRSQRINGVLSVLAAGLFGIVSGCVYYALAAVAANVLIGALAAYTGRRTENGTQIQDEILGLRRYMRRVTKAELARIMRSNPDYYYELAPYALALGVDRQFAARFGNLRQTNCTWLVNGLGAASTAIEWYSQLREAVNSMNDPKKRSVWDKLLTRR